MPSITNESFQLIVVLIAFGTPLVIYYLSPRFIKGFTRRILPLTYCIVILYFTLISKHRVTNRSVNLIPFYSYTKMADSFFRWQVLMNIFLFIPLGFLIPFASKKTFLQTLIFGCCLSIGIELLQFIFALGLCETDDVIHNTLGCIIGYWYWFGLSKLGEKLHRDRE